jgi:hypothetical protein
MPTFPVRRLGSSGIVTDTHPADLEDVGTFTAGVNVRFANGRVTRAPVARGIIDIPYEPGHLLMIPPSSAGVDQIVSVSYNYAKISRLNGAIWEDLTPPAHVGSAGDFAITSCFLGGLSYVNRESHVPLYKSNGGSTYLNLPAWSAGDRCKVLRAYKDQLIALGVTKAGTYYPTMVKWSDFASFNVPPVTWDPGEPTASAGENVVNEMNHEIVDGLTLRDTFIIYCSGSVWRMSYVGGNALYDFGKLYDEVGVISPNCVVQVGGLHYVFDRNDIYVHDGASSPRSIADTKVKSFIFDALDYAKAHLCFVTHDARLTEIRFSYPSGDRLTGFPNATTGCNRQAVFNYSNGAWTFYDVPNVVGSCKSALISGDSWNTDPDITFDEIGGQWMASEGDEDRHVIMAGRIDTSQGLTASRLYGFDLINGGRLPMPVHPETLKPAFLERVGIDLDSMGKNLTQYTNLQAIWPQMSADIPADIYWQFGATDNVNAQPLWSAETTFDPSTESRIDINEAGKYLGYRMGLRGQGDFIMSGFDVLLILRGRR